MSRLANKFRINKPEPQYTVSADTSRKKKESKLYPIISKLPFLSGYIEELQLQLYSTYSDELAIRKKIMVLLENAVIAMIIVFTIIIWKMDKTLYNVLIAVVVSAIIGNSFVKSGVRDNDKLLEELPDAIEDLKQNFIIEKTMPAAYKKTVEESTNTEIKMQFMRISKIIDAPKKDAKLLLNKYFEQCRNRFLKILAAYSYLTVEHGDVIIGLNGKRMRKKEQDTYSLGQQNEEGESLFARNMNYLKSEIRLEYRKRKRIKMQLAGLKYFTILPVFLIPMIKQYIMTYFAGYLADAQNFYLSSFGYVDALFCAATSILCYIGYNEIQKVDVADKISNMAKKSWEDQILRFKPVASLVRRLTPGIESPRYKAITDKMVVSGNYQKLEWFYLKKVITAALALVSVLCIIQTTQVINQKRIYEDLFYGIRDQVLYKNIIENTGIPKDKLLEADKKVIDMFLKGKSFKRDDNEIREQYQISLGQEVGDNVMQITMERLEAKLKYMEGEKSGIRKLETLLFIIIITFTAYKLPNIRLNIAVRSNKASMADEVMRMQTVIVLLIRHSHVTPEIIIDWLITFSDIFYKPLMEVKNNYNKLGGTKAIEKLEVEVSYKPFKRLLRNLALAEEKLPLEEAFASLEQDRMYNEEIRRDSAEIIVEDRVAIGRTLSNTSFFITVICYLVAPVAYAIIVMMITTFGKIQGLLQ